MPFEMSLKMHRAPGIPSGELFNELCMRTPPNEYNKEES